MNANDISDKLELGQLFDTLNDEQLVQLKFRSEARRYEQGEYLVREGDKGTEVYMILLGSAQVEKRVPGRDEVEVLAQLDEGEFVGEMVLLGQYYRSASVRAIDDMEVLLWTKTDLDGVFEANEKIGYIVMRNLASILCERLGATDLSLIKHVADRHE